MFQNQSISCRHLRICHQRDIEPDVSKSCVFGRIQVTSGLPVIQERAENRQRMAKCYAIRNNLSLSGSNTRSGNSPIVKVSIRVLCAHAQELPTVAVLSTGGTIASKYDPVKGGYVPALSGQDLVAAVPAVKKIAQIRVEQISNIPSPEITPEIWIRLATRVNDLLARPDIAGIVITHGTSTLEETAYFLDLTTMSTNAD